MENSGYHWKKVTFVKKGDLIHRWGDDLEILDTHLLRLKVILEYKDGDLVQFESYKVDAEVLIKDKEGDSEN